MPIPAAVKPLVGVAQLVELEAGAPVTEHSRRRFDSGHQHRASSDAARCANTLCGKYRMTNIEAAALKGTHCSKSKSLGTDYLSQPARTNKRQSAFADEAGIKPGPLRCWCIRKLMGHQPLLLGSVKR